MPRHALILPLLLMTIPATVHAQSAREVWRTDVPCASARRLLPEGADAGEPAAFSPCPTRTCVDLPGGGRVCTCGGTEGPDSLRIEQPGHPVRDWGAETDGLAAASGWEAVVAPIGEGGAPMVVIAQRTAVSNGLGVNYWQLWLAEPGGEGAPPFIEVQEYDFRGSWVQPRAGGACRLFATRWMGGSEPGRGPGLYLQGRWMAWSGGQLRADLARPVVERRYLFSFERERFAGVSGAPFAWFRGPAARRTTLPRTPAVDSAGN